MTDMTWFINNGGVSEDEIMLGKPDEIEAADLKTHVRKCALRYSIFTRRLSTQSDDIALIKYMMFAVIGFILITSPQAKDFLSWVAHLS